MNRADLQSLTDLRLEDAEILLAAGRFEGAYYLLVITWLKKHW